MIYTLNDLEVLIKNPVNTSKWGNDTYRIISLISRIIGAPCIRCAEKRYIQELNSILQKYGDSVQSHQYIPKDTPNRRHCIDCTIKHISQAFVLQSEFYQGYTEYVKLIEAHLNEAYEECPPDNHIIKNAIAKCLKKISIDGTPEIPISLILTQDKRPSDDVINETTSVVPPEMDVHTETSKLSDSTKEIIKELLQNISDYSDYNDILSRADWSGRLACCADICAIESPTLAQVIRYRRLNYYTRPSLESKSIMNCTDILEAL